MDIDSDSDLPMPSYLVSPTISDYTLSPNCESRQRNDTALSPPEISSPYPLRVSDTAIRRIPLTASFAKNALETGKDIRVASVVPEKSIYYDSRGELLIPLEHLSSSRISTYSPIPPPYDTFGYFYPLQLPNTIQPSTRTPDVPTSVFQPLPNVPLSAHRIPTKTATKVPGSIKLCKTRDCNATIPFKYYKQDYCKRCMDYRSRRNADLHSRDGSSTPSTPVAPRSPALNYTSGSDPRIQIPPPSTIPTFVHKHSSVPLSVRSTSILTTRSVSYPESRSPSQSISPITAYTTNTSCSSLAVPNASPNVPIPNIESVTVGKKRSRCVTEPILASTSAVGPSTAMAVKKTPEARCPDLPDLPPIPRIPLHPLRSHLSQNSQPQTRVGPLSQKTKRTVRSLPKPTPSTKPSVSSIPASTPSTSNAPSKTGKLSDPWLLRITSDTTERKCITPSCTDVIPLSSSPYTLRCLSCVKADWIARKQGVESLIQAHKAKSKSDKEEQEIQDEKDKKERQRAKRRDSGLSISSVLSLSSLTSLEDEEETEPSFNSTDPKSVSEPDLGVPLTPISKPKVVLKFSGEVWRRAKNSRYCSDDGCCKRLEEGYSESCCVRCRAKKRERMKVFGVSCTVLWGMRGILGDLRGAQDVRDDEDEEDEEVAMGDVIPGARLCAARWCSHVLPTKDEYKWSMCLGCRSYLVKREQRQGKLDSEENKGKKKLWGSSLWSGRDTNGAEQRCSSLDCGMLVQTSDEGPERRSISLCAQCIRRKARESERIERVREMMGSTTSSSTKFEQKEAPTKAPSTCKASCYPEFISLAALIARFRAQLHSFLQGQALLTLRKRYFAIDDTLRCESSTSASPADSTIKPQETQNLSPASTPLGGPLFTFVGQFSTACSTQNILSASNRTAILSHLVYVRSELERASLLPLKPQNPKDPLITFKEGFMLKFGCMHSLPLKWSFSDEHGQSNRNNEKQGSERDAETIDIRKDVKGELDIIVVPDHSHHILPGQTTAIKFRMGIIDSS